MTPSAIRSPDREHGKDYLCAKARGWWDGAQSATMRGMEKTTLEKLARLSGKATSKGLDSLARHGFDLRAKLSAPISRVPRRAPPPQKPKSDA